ncbi:hypothetical protein EFO40_12110 [Lactococcus cremoris]|nr:hypothetical protein [Lactococcus cremoris]
MMFSDRYIQKVVNTKSHLCVGLDPILENFPSYILKKAESIYGKTPRGAVTLSQFFRVTNVEF